MIFIPLVLLFSTLALTATDIYLPSLPAIEGALHTSSQLVQLSISVYLLTYSTSQLIYGPFSDRFGRKPMAMIGLCIALVGTVVALFAPNITTLLIGRFIQGYGLGAGSLFRPILRDVYHGPQLSRVSSLVTTLSATMMAVAPTVGGYVELYAGWRYNFVILGIWVAVALVGIAFGLPETNQHRNPHAIRPRHMLANYWTLLKNPLFIGYAGCTAMGYAALTAYLTASPFLIQTTIGVGPVAYGWLALVLAGGLIVGAWISRHIVQQTGTGRMVTASLLTMLLASLAVLFLGYGWTNLWTLMTPIFVLSIGMGVIFPNAYAGALTPFPKMAGAAGALYGMIQVLGAFIASVVASALSEATQRPLGWTLCGAAILGLLCERWAHKREAPCTTVD